MGRTLYLHIGSHKTGTSAIQAACARNATRLRTRGWTFATCPGRPLNWGHLFRFRQEEGFVRFWLFQPALKTLTDALQSRSGKVILSIEDLFFLPPAQVEKLAGLLCPMFDEIIICAYLRRQDELAISQKAQGAKTIQSALVFGTDPGALPGLNRDVRAYLDLSGKLKMWKDAFGGATILAREYDRQTFKSGDVAQDFFNLLGLRLKGLPGEVNAALSGNQTRMLLQLRALGFSQADVHMIRTQGWLAEDDSRLTVTRDDARAFVETFRASNAALPNVLGTPFAFHNRFDQYPETLADTGYAEYERASLRTIVQHLGQGANVANGLLLQKAALALEDTSPDMAIELLEMARRMHPAAESIPKILRRLTRDRSGR